MRSPHPNDSRAIMISLNEKGKEANAAHEEVHLQFYNQLRTLLNVQEIEIFEKCIDKLNSFFWT